MAPFSIPAKPAIWIACAGIAAGVAGFLIWRAVRRGGDVEELLPRVDVTAYNDALMAP